MNYYLARNDEAYLVKELPDNSLRVDLRDGTTLTFRPQSWRVMDYGWLIPWNGWETHLKPANAKTSGDLNR
jgi:hypothetical protein